ncbi:hypothetical protein [Methanococcus sp. CF]
MYAEISEEELLKKFDECINSEDVKKKTEAPKLLGRLGLNEIKSRMDAILQLAAEENISIRLNLITAFSNILNKFPEVFSELISYIYFNTEFSNNILLEHAKNEIKSFKPDVIERHVEYFRNGIYSKNTEERLKSIVGLSLISRFSPEYLDKALSEIVMVSTYDKSQLIQLIALGTLDDFSELDRNLLRYSYIVFNEKTDIKPLDNSKTNTEISKALINLAISKKMNENTIIELLPYLSSENDFYALLAAIALHNNISEVKTTFSNYTLVFYTQISKFYKKHMNNLPQLVSYYLILDISRILNLELKSVDFEKVFYYLKKNIFRKNHLSKSYSLKILYTLYKTEKLDLNGKIDEMFDDYPFKNILKEHPLCYHFGMPLLLEKYNTIPDVEESPYLINSLELKLQYMSDVEINRRLKSAEKKFESSYWLDRYESAKKFGTILHSDISKHFMNFDLVSQIHHDEVYLVRNIGIWILRILVKYDIKIPEKIILEIIDSLNSPYWELRFEYYLLLTELFEKTKILNNSNTALNIKSVLENQFATEKHSSSKIVIKNLLDKISKNLENSSQTFYDVPDKDTYLESFLESSITDTFLEKLKINLNSYILKNDEENILKMLKFLKIRESELDCSYLLEEIVKLKKYEDANYLLNNIKQRSILIPSSIENKILNSLNNPIPEYKKDGLEEILVYLNEGFELDNEIGISVKETLVMYRDEKLTDLCLKILELQNDIESGRLVREKKEFDAYLNDLKEIKEQSDETIKLMSPKELYVVLSHQLHKKSGYNYKSINFNDILYFLLDYSKRPSVILTTMILKILKNVVNDPNSNILNSSDIDNPKVMDNLYYLIFSTDYEILSKNALLLTAEIVKNKPEWLLKNISDNSKNKNWSLFLNLLLTYPDDKVISETLSAVDYYSKNSKLVTFSKDFPEKLVALLNTSNWTNFKKILNILANYPMNDEMLNFASKLMLEKIENSNDDSKLILLRFFKIQDISKLNEDLITRLLGLKNSKNYDIKREIEEIELKITH